MPLHRRFYITSSYDLEQMAKKVAISITIDGDVLRSVDSRLRSVQEKELGRGRLRSNRSNLIEQVLRDWADGVA